MESPNQYLSPKPWFSRNGCTSFEIQGSKVCSTIRPLTLDHCFGFFQRTHVWKAPTNTFHQSLGFLKLVAPVSRSKGPKCTIRPLTLDHCFGFFQRTHVWKAPTNTFHQSLGFLGLVAPVSRSKGPKCARLSAPSLWTTVLVSFRGPVYGKPQPIPFTKALVFQEWLHQFRDPRVQSVLDYPPPYCGPLFWFLSKDLCMESPNQYLSPEPWFSKIGCTSFEIQGSKVCLIIRPPTLDRCFSFFQGTHVWKAPTNTFHQSLGFPGMVAPVSRSKGPKCARLSAPLLRNTVLVSLRGPMYGKPQPMPFTRALIF